MEPLDLRHITRDSNLIKTTILTRNLEYDLEPLIICGRITIDKRGEKHNVHARMDATDFEHDSAYAFGFNVIGLSFESCWNGSFLLGGFMDPDPTDLRDFQIPESSDYDPTSLLETVWCQNEECKNKKYKHLIIPEEYYTPRVNRELWKKLRGRKVQIQTSVLKED